MTHGAQSAARVTGPCFAMGEAAGTAAGLALTGGIGCGDVDVAVLQQRLRTPTAPTSGRNGSERSSQE